jgi:hypothetical protein
MSNKKLLMFFFILALVEAIAVIIWLASLPAESGNAFAFGYSFQRLILMGGMGFLGVLCLLAAWLIGKTPSAFAQFEQLFNNIWTGIIDGLLVVIAWVLCFLPAYQWGGFAGYKGRLLPILLWVLLVGIQFGLIVIIQRKKTFPGSFWKVMRKQPVLIKGWLVALIFVTIGLVSVAVFRIGLIPDIVYWNDTNVPILGIQIIGVVFGSIIFLAVLSHFGFFKLRIGNTLQNNFSDLIICLLLWGLAVICWTQIAMPHSYFSPGPYPPNNEVYPFSDAARYDSAAHIAIIGEGLGTNNYVDKPLYVAFLTFIHLIVGNRTDSVVGMQVAFIALIPMLIYLLGWKVHNRLGGLLAACFFIFREINNIQGTLWVLSTNSRVLMSESLVALLLVIFVLMLTGWVKNTRKMLPLISAGGVLGLAGLVRLNPLLLMPVIFIVIWLTCWKKWKRGLINCLAFSMIFLATIFPWMLQSYFQHGNFLYFKSTMNGVVIGQRTYYSLNKPTEKNVVGEQAKPSEPAEQQPANKTWNKITGISRYVSAHFFHNMISATAIFPTTLTLDSLETTIKSPQSYWDPDWNGAVSAGRMIMICLALILVCLGISASWQRSRWAGLVPAGFMIAYSLATAAARTSGGRYFLPADWVMLLYFAIGISQIVEWNHNWLQLNILQPAIEPQTEDRKSGKPYWQLGAAACFFIFLGCSPILFDRAIPRQYPLVDKSTLFEDLKSQGLIDPLGISEAELKTFLQSPNAVIYKGRGLYPRFYSQDQGEPDRFSAMRGQAFPRLVMDVINQNGAVSGVLPLLQSPNALPNGSEILAIGCRGELNDDWLSLIVGDTNKQIIMRTPAAKWVCPVTLPVCDNNRICQ